MLRQSLIILLTFIGFATAASAENSIEIGVLRGAQFRILKPAQWNGQLIIWCSGYTPVPIEFNGKERVPDFAAALLDDGYAVAESGYSRGGVAVEQAMEDSNELRKYFKRKHPKTSAVYVVGESMGGLIALRLVEEKPRLYRAGLSFCGMLSTPFDYVRQAFDLLALFSYYEPSLLPSPAEVPSGFRPSPEIMQGVAKALQANGEAKESLQIASGASDVGTLAGILVFHTDLMRDVQSKCGGNPVNNTGTVYSSRSDADRVNAGVLRVASAPGAASCLKAIGEARRGLVRPFLAVDVSRDPVVSGRFGNSYDEYVSGTPAEQWFVRQFIPAQGHCSVPAKVRVEAFQATVRWAEAAANKPKAGFIAKAK